MDRFQFIDFDTMDFEHSKKFLMGIIELIMETSRLMRFSLAVDTMNDNRVNLPGLMEKIKEQFHQDIEPIGDYCFHHCEVSPDEMKELWDKSMIKFQRIRLCEFFMAACEEISPPQRFIIFHKLFKDDTLVYVARQRQVSLSYSRTSEHFRYAVEVVSRSLRDQFLRSLDECEKKSGAVSDNHAK